MKVGVSGASGFLGRALVSRLTDDGNFDPISFVRTADLGDRQIGIGDLASEDAIELPPVDAVVHLAGITRSGVGDGADVLARYRRVNVEGTAKLLAAAARAGARHFVFISSIKVNGERTTGAAFNEADGPSPEDAYGMSKLEAENLVRSFCDAHGMGWTIIRPPLVYGPGAAGNFAMLRRLALGRLPIPFGGFSAPRSMIFSGNLVDLIVTTLRNPAARNQVFLASDGEDVAVRDLVLRMGQAAGRRPVMVTLPEILVRMALRIPTLRTRIGKLGEELRIDPSRAREILGWSPPHTLDEGLRLSVAQTSER